MFNDFFLALRQVTDRKFMWVLLKALALSLALFVGAYWSITSLAVAYLPGSLDIWFVGPVPVGDWFGSIAFVGVLFMAMFLMFPVAIVFVGIFLEEIADAVEKRHYPHLPEVEPLSFGAMLGEALRFLLLMIVLNVLALIIYFASTLLAPVIFWVVNGYLLGREYFQLVAMRRLGMKAADKLRKQHRWEIWFAGVLMAIPLSVPVLNLFIPLLGVATFTHVFHRLNSSDHKNQGLES